MGTFCKACKSRIIWIETRAGKMMPCNPEPVRFYEVGGEVFVQKDGSVMHGTRSETGDHVGFVSHFSTCQHAAIFKR